MNKLFSFISSLFTTKGELEKLKEELYNLDMALKEAEKQLNSLITENESLKLQLKEYKNLTVPSAVDKEAWYALLPQTKVYYLGKDVRSYVKESLDRPQSVQDFATKVQEGLTDLTPTGLVEHTHRYILANVQSQLRGSTKPLRYVKEVGDDWKTPERTLKEFGDCEDYAILFYCTIRIIAKRLGFWDKMVHRLWLVADNVNKPGLPFNAGSHAHLEFIHDDSRTYTIETTYYTNKAVANFGKLAQIDNPMYGNVIFKFNEERSIAHEDAEILERLDYSKRD